MRGRFVKDESGIALPVAIMMVVLVGVMGAGLLTFAVTSVNSVAEVNRGQKTFDMADAGVQAAKRQLISNAAPTHYDGTNAPNATPVNPESPWSYAAPAPGKTLSLDGCTNCISVKIRYLLPATTQAQQENQGNPGCQDASRACYAPVLLPSGQTNYPSGEDYFLIVSEGKQPSGANAGEARRRIETIYTTQTTGVPQGYYTDSDIVISGNISLEGLSMFARGKITNNGTLNVPATNASGGPNIDIAYGDWNRPPWNTRTRGKTAPGLGAAGTVPNISGEFGVRDFGSNSPPPLVLRNPPDGAQPANQISFPFDHRQQPNLEDASNAAKSQNITAARPQGNYYDVSGGTVDLVADTASGTYKWPANSTAETVVYIKFATYSSSNVVNWDVSSSGGTRRGTLVVENGKLEMKQSTNSNPKCLTGVAVVRVPATVPSDTEVFTNTGQGCLEGYVNANRSIKIAGTVKPFTQDRGNRPGFFRLQLWSWREMYK